ncbi:MAG: PaaI family thioesterase [Thermodesulfobacteriota bacterium]|nr:PaaI family thioesterase [Thermodesulfobacteriota bacterium]
MKKQIQNPYPDNNCFFCGIDNSQGLKLKFYWDEEKEEMSAEYLPAKHFTGQGNILHGAIQMGLLDEIMGWASYTFTREMAVTSSLDVKFIRPLYICGEQANITCRVTSKEGAKINMQATLSNNDGDACTIATGIFHVLHPKKYKDLIQGKNNRRAR